MNCIFTKDEEKLAHLIEIAYGTGNLDLVKEYQLRLTHLMKKDRPNAIVVQARTEPNDVPDTVQVRTEPTYLQTQMKQCRYLGFKQVPREADWVEFKDAIPSATVEDFFGAWLKKFSYTENDVKQGYIEPALNVEKVAEDLYNRLKSYEVTCNSSKVAQEPTRLDWLYYQTRYPNRTQEQFLAEWFGTSETK